MNFRITTLAQNIGPIYIRLNLSDCNRHLIFVNTSVTIDNKRLRNIGNTDKLLDRWEDGLHTNSREVTPVTTVTQRHRMIYPMK